MAWNIEDEELKMEDVERVPYSARSATILLRSDQRELRRTRSAG
jgi:hypothetical protein